MIQSVHKTIPNLGHPDSHATKRWLANANRQRLGAAITARHRGKESPLWLGSIGTDSDNGTHPPDHFK